MRDLASCAAGVTQAGRGGRGRRRGGRGFALYRTEQHWDERFGNGDVSVQEAMAADPAALAALYRYLFDLDLMGHATVRVAVDDPVPHWLTDPRSAKPSLNDCLYVRLVDVPRALAGAPTRPTSTWCSRSRDDLCPWNAGTWRLRAAAGGDATVRADRRRAGPVAGRPRARGGLPGRHVRRGAGGAGLVVERTPGAVTAASAAFGHHPAPWTSWVF